MAKKILCTLSSCGPDNCLKQNKLDIQAKRYLWQAAIGLQKVDGIEASAYLLEIAKRNIDGEISIDEVIECLDSYYAEYSENAPSAVRTFEADKVAAKTVKILSESTFQLSIEEYLAIHGQLFEGVYKFAGRIRDYNISKPEWVLGGETICYADVGSIHDMLSYDFNSEIVFNYKGLPQEKIIDHLCKFISNLWQIHAFGEGNTRTAAVFLTKYLRTLGFKTDIGLFKKYSRYFRNALVRANFNNHSKGICVTNEFLWHFLDNLLFNGKNVLRSRDLKLTSSSSNKAQDKAHPVGK